MSFSLPLTIRILPATIGLIALAGSPLPTRADDDAYQVARAINATTPSIDLLRNRALDLLEARFEKLQAAYEADTHNEQALRQALRELTPPNPEVETLLDDWVRSAPRSYAARTARGAFRIAMAHAWRGNGWAKDTLPPRFEMMQRYLDAASRDLEDALALTAKPVLAIEMQMAILRMSGRSELLDVLLSKAVALDPFAVGPRKAYLHALLPRWGGSYDAMHAFGETFSRETHPKLKGLPQITKATIVWDRGNAAELKRDYVAAVQLYEEANAVTEDADVLCSLGHVYHIIGQTQKGIDLMSRGLGLAPLYANCYLRRSDARFAQKNPTAGIADLRLAVELGDTLAKRRLGLLLLNGDEGVQVDTSEGLRWLEAAAYFWDEYALFVLGKTYERGPGVSIDLQRAATYFRYSANLGYGPAENDLGLMLWYGNGVAQDKTEAVRLWRRAAARGIWQAEHNLEYFLHPVDRILVKVGIILEPGKEGRPLLISVGVALLLILLFLRRKRTQTTATPHNGTASEVSTHQPSAPDASATTQRGGTAGNGSWEDIRKKGRSHFVLRSGVLAWGIPMYLAMAVLPAIGGQVTSTLYYFAWTACLWGTAGAVFGLAVWHVSERKHAKERGMQSRETRP